MSTDRDGHRPDAAPRSPAAPRPLGFPGLTLAVLAMTAAAVIFLLVRGPDVGILVALGALLTFQLTRVVLDVRRTRRARAATGSPSGSDTDTASRPAGAGAQSTWGAW